MNCHKTILFSALLSAASITAQAQDYFDSADGLLRFTIVDGGASVAAKSITSLSGDLTIPATCTDDDGNTYNVVAVTASGFAGGAAITSVTLPEGLQTVGNSAFGGCSGVTKLVLPSTLKSIGETAFSTISVTELAIPKSVSQISTLAFTSCTSLTKVTIEDGSALETINYGTFNGCSNLEEVIVGDGVASLSAGAFNACSGLKTITLPRTIKSIGSGVFEHLSKLETVKLYAAQPELASSCFVNDSEASNPKLYVPDPANYADYADNFPGGILKLYSFADDTAEGATTPTISATDGQSAIDIFYALADTTWQYVNSDVTLKNNVAFDATELDMTELSAGNIFTVLDLVPTVRSYDGHMTGASISNMAVRSSGLFGTLGPDAEIDGLVLEDATIYVDPTDTSSYEIDGDDVTIHILAKTNNGKVTNFGFSGDIIVDESLASGKEISVCAVNTMGDNAEINGFLHIGSLQSTGNTKRCITIKQNLGVKRPPGKSTKMATSKSLSADNKTLSTNFTYTDEELTQSIRAFSDEEFAGGAVAYWLNYSGPGYTGDYTGYWSQGKKVPVPATTVDGVTNALFAVDYGTTDLTHLTAGPQFANNGSQITIAYDEKPTSVLIGGEAYTGFGENSMTVTFDHAKAISLSFNKSTTTDLAQPKAQLIIRTAGRTITVISSSPMRNLRLYALTGGLVAESDGESINAPGRGIFLLNVDGRTFKVVVK